MEQNTEFKKELHCSHCGRFLGFESILEGTILLLCPKCKGWTKFQMLIDNTTENTIDNQ